MKMLWSLIHKETAVYQDFVQFIMKRIQNPWLGGILIDSIIEQES